MLLNRDTWYPTAAKCQNEALNRVLLNRDTWYPTAAKCQNEANNRMLLNTDTWYPTDAKPLNITRDQSFMSSETLHYAIWENVTDVLKVPRSFEVSATLYESTLPNISGTPTMPLKEPQIYQNSIGFDNSIWNTEYETPAINCLGDPPNQAVIEVAAWTRRIAKYNFVF